VPPLRNRGGSNDVQPHVNTLRKLTLAAATMLALTVAAACGEVVPGAGGSPDGSPDELAGGWRLTDGEGPDGPIPIVDSHDITLVIEEDGSWGGTAACNSYGATVELDGTDLRVTELFQTEMACIEEGVMESEAAYLTAFGQVTSFEVADEVLTLHGDGVRLDYDLQPHEPEASVIGTTRPIESLLEGWSAGGGEALPSAHGA
jgi:heat shock protein HslJ